MSENEAIVAERAMWNRQHLEDMKEKHRKLALDYDALFIELLSREPREG